MPGEPSPKGEQSDFTEAEQSAADRALDRIAREDAMKPSGDPLRKVKPKTDGDK